MVGVDRGWLAGFFDGESNLAIYGNTIKVDIQQSSLDGKCPKVFYTIQSRFGGTVGESATYWNSRRNRYIVRYRFTVWGEQALDLLRYILEDLVLKKGQARAAIMWYTTRGRKYLKDFLEITHGSCVYTTAEGNTWVKVAWSPNK